MANGKLVQSALEALGIRTMLLGVFDAALPGDPRDDLGRGAPLSRGGLEFLRFAAGLGFSGLQLGPQGATTEIDASPYDGTLFSREPLSIAFGPLVEQGLLAREALAAAVAERPAGAEQRVPHRHVFHAVRRLLDEAFDRFGAAELLEQFGTANGGWLERDSLYAAAAEEHDEPDWLRWPRRDRELWDPAPGEEGSAKARRSELLRRHSALVARYEFEQLVAHEQHDAFHRRARELGLELYGDLQIGVAHQDIWSWSSVFVPGLRMGAPPSRTNPEGQPWNYAVLDPELYGSADAPGPAAEFARERVRKVLAGCEGLRIDHPHGLIDPWVYRTGAADLLRAVQQGARLFSSPDVRDLGAYAIAREDQLDRSQPRYADGWVRDLSEEQVARYAIVFDAIVREASAPQRLVAEVLSTQPRPVGRVLRRHGLGRFRVTQKVRLDDPGDVYRSENAAPEDWVLAGNHDTDPVWRVAERWVEQGSAAAHARYLASRLGRDARWAERTGRDPLALARAKLAELFVGPARQVLVFFSDLLGLRDPYNRPGTVSDENWSLRIPPGWEAAYDRDCRDGRALDLPAALATALRARGGPAALIRALDAAAQGRT
jgi:4-alpha-glucanotransferase